MSIENIIGEAVETLDLASALSCVLVFPDVAGGMDEELRLKIAKHSAFVKVGWNGFTPLIQGETAPNGEIFGTLTVVAHVFEKIDVNRRTIGTMTCQEIAKAIARELHGASAEGMDGPLFLRKISPVSELVSGNDGSFVTCDVEFETKTSI